MSTCFLRSLSPASWLVLACVGGACAGGAETTARVASAATDGARGATADDARVAEQGPTRIVGIHRSKCGSCHTPVQPGSLPRAEAEAAMGRHHRRLRLAPQDWAGMIDYLTGDGVKHAGTPARVP
jgi:hypothetical protein